MLISIVHWRIEVGIFNLRSFVRLAKFILSVNCGTFFIIILFILLCTITLILICVDVELNPGPKKTKHCYNFSLCRWNLDSITTRMFSKISMLEFYNSQHKFNMLGISETYLDSSFPTMIPD